MRILLAANASYVPPRGGATRSNLIWLDQLAAAGHDCRIVCAALSAGSGARRQIDEECLAAPAAIAPGVEHARRGAIEAWQVEEPARRLEVLRKQVAEFAPDWVLVSSEDLSHSLLREAQHLAPGRVVYLAHTPQFFPFGRLSWNHDSQGAALVQAAAGIVAISHAMAHYIEDALGRTAAVVHPPLYGQPPFPRYDNFAQGLVTMINPCAAKGVSIFADVARSLPGREFGFIPGWGTTADDLRTLAALPNMRALPNCREIDELLSATRVLLMPSLWFEGFGLIVMEAMLRGIPVIASDSGGLVEAKSGTGYVIPVRPITRYRDEFDERAMPLPELPENPVEPWCQAVEELLTDRAAYTRESERSRVASVSFVAGLDAGGLERYLLGLPRGTMAAPAARTTIESLSPARRALLLERLRKRAGEAG